MTQTAPDSGRDRFDDLNDTIVAGRQRLPKRLAQAAEYALANPEEIALGTAASVAEAAQVQPSTLVRLARHLGFEGFSDLQGVFRERLLNRASSYEERLRRIKRGAEAEPGAGTPEATLIDGFLSAAMLSLETLAADLDRRHFSRCVNILENANTIFIIARRRAYPLAAQLGYAFGKLRIRSQSVDSANGIDAEIVALASRDDAAIVCSFSPYAPETIAYARSLAAREIPMVALTDSPASPLASLTPHWIQVRESDFGGFRSLSAAMALSMGLAVAIAERRLGR